MHRIRASSHSGEGRRNKEFFALRREKRKLQMGSGEAEWRTITKVKEIVKRIECVLG